MTRFTTPVLPLDVYQDLTGMRVFATVSQGKEKVTKEIDSFEVTAGVTRIYMPLTQEDTAKFSSVAGVQIQVNWIDSNEIRSATEIKQIISFDNLLDEVIYYTEPEPDPEPEGEDDGD